MLNPTVSLLVSLTMLVPFCFKTPQDPGLQGPVTLLIWRSGGASVLSPTDPMWILVDCI